MGEWSSIKSFLEPSLAPPAAELGRIWTLAQTRVAGAELPFFKVRATDAGDWWICSVEGVGLTTIKGDLQTVPPPDYVLLTLALNGRYQLRPHSRLVTEANTISLHRWTPEVMGPITTWGTFHYFIFYLPLKTLEPRFSDRPPYGRTVYTSSGPGAVVAACLRTFAREILRRQQERSLTPMQDNIVEMVARAFTAADASRQPIHRSPFDTIRTYIEEHLTDPLICPRSVATACNLSERQFYRVFEQRGQTFGKFLRQLRLERAGYLLRSDCASPITEIAYDCGFSSPSYFGQMFRDYFGSSPSEYRSPGCGDAADPS